MITDLTGAYAPVFFMPEPVFAPGFPFTAADNSEFYYTNCIYFDYLYNYKSFRMGT